MKITKILFIIITFILLTISVSSLEGGTIIGDTQVFETTEAKMVVAPHTSFSLSNSYHQNFKITNKLGSDLTDIWVAFRFNSQLSSSSVCEVIQTENKENTTWVNVSSCVDRTSAFSYTEMNGKHYYYLTSSTNWNGLEMREFNIDFSYINPTEFSKYDMAIWKGTFECILDNSCAFSRILDPYTSDYPVGLLYLREDSISVQSAANEGGDGHFGFTFSLNGTGEVDLDYLSLETFQEGGSTENVSCGVYTTNASGLNFIADKLIGGETYNDQIQNLPNPQSDPPHEIWNFSESNVRINRSEEYAIVCDVGHIGAPFLRVSSNTTGTSHRSKINMGSATAVISAVSTFEFQLHGSNVSRTPSFVSVNSPAHDSNLSDVTSVVLNVTVFDPDNDNLNVSFFDSDGALIDFMMDVNASTNWSANVTYSGLTNGTYNWSVSITDGITTNTSDTFNFTVNLPSNTPPSVNGTNNPTDDSTVPYTQSVLLNVTVFDPENDNLNVSFFEGNGSLIGTVTDINNTNNWLATINYPALTNLTYVWSVNVTDGEFSVVSTFNFTISNPPVCNNGLDDDNDTFTDFPSDTGCSALNDSDERGLLQCDDGIDNDGDTFIDYPHDTGCTNITDTLELNPQCNNGLDDDGDGYIDLLDYGCESNPLDNDESLPRTPYSFIADYEMADIAPITGNLIGKTLVETKGFTSLIIFLFVYLGVLGGLVFMAKTWNKVWGK